MNATNSTCACRGQEKPIGTCFRCGNNLCERCVVFISGQAVCSSCARNHEDSILVDVGRARSARRRVDVTMADSQVPTDDLKIKRKHQLRKVMRTLNKCFEHACMVMVLIGIIGTVIFFSHIMDFASTYARSAAEKNRQNPLARLVIGLAGRTDMLYMRYDPAIGHFLDYMDLYPKHSRIPECYYRIGMCFLNKRDFVLAKHYLTQYTKKFPDHEYNRQALEKIGIIDRALAAAELSTVPVTADSAD